MNNFISRDGFIESDVAFGAMLGAPIVGEYGGVEYGPNISMLMLAELALQAKGFRAEIEDVPLSVCLLTSYYQSMASRSSEAFDEAPAKGVHLFVDTSRLSEKGTSAFFDNPQLPSSIGICKANTNNRVYIKETRPERPLGREVEYPLAEAPRDGGVSFSYLRERFLSTATALFTRWDRWDQDDDGLWIPPSPEVDRLAHES